jgi:hypothetical protein
LAEQTTRRDEVQAAEQFYTPGKVRGWLEKWDMLKTLARGSCPGIGYDEIAFGGTYANSNPGYYAEIVADIERAVVTLHRWSLEYQMVEWSMRGYSLPTIAQGLRVSYTAADEAMHQSALAIAFRLGWTENLDHC